MTLFRVCHLIAALSLGAGAARAQSAGGISIVPRPDSLAVRSGWFKLTPRTVIWTDRGDSAVAVRFARTIAPALGFQPRVAVGSSSSGSRIVFRRAPQRDSSLGREGYRLDVKPGVVTIVAPTPAGAFYATQTLRQLFPPQIFRDAAYDSTDWRAPGVSIIDRPRFQWRGMTIAASGSSKFVR